MWNLGGWKYSVLLLNAKASNYDGMTKLKLKKIRMLLQNSI